MRRIWMTRAELRVENYSVQFLALMENEYDRDPMCDCVGKKMVPTGDYQVKIRSLFESTAASPVLNVDTTRQFGNQMFREIRGMTTDKQLEDYIAYIAYNILKNGKKFFKIYQDKYSGYYDGTTVSTLPGKEMYYIVHDYPVRQMNWEGEGDE